MFELVQSRLGFNFTFVDSIDGTPGILGPDGNWSGLIGMIQRKYIDFGIQGNSMLSQRTEVERNPLNVITIYMYIY
jgi:hypothetical protein